MKKHWLTILLVLVLVVGLSLMLYPTVSNWWNSMHQSMVVSNYVEQVANMDNQTYKEVLNQAKEYNKLLASSPNDLMLNGAQQARYEECLDITGTGVMGYIEIPSIDVKLPIYHGTSEPVLQVAVGHLSWTSLPVGGESSHCVLSGHRGLPSARLFTDLDRLKVGDVFTLFVLDESITYKIDQILVVEPEETNPLMIVNGQDYCTLTTCTPYGINSHRMLLRGSRVADSESDGVRVTADAVRIDPLIVAPFIAIPMLLILSAFLLTSKPKKNRRKSS